MSIHTPLSSSIPCTASIVTCNQKFASSNLSGGNTARPDLVTAVGILSDRIQGPNLSTGEGGLVGVTGNVIPSPIVPFCPTKRFRILDRSRVYIPELTEEGGEELTLGKL